MNLYGIVVLVALLVDYLLNVLADRWNLDAAAADPPPGFEHVYDPERYEASREYTRARTRFELVPMTVHLAVLLAFWFLGGFAWLDERFREAGWGPIWTGLGYIGSLALARGILNLPFRWYSTFRIEERFGFNKTTPRTFWADTVKGLLLGGVLGGLLLAAILWFFQRAGDSAWLYGWAVTAMFAVAIQFVAPTWILPLFHRFQPLEKGELRDSILEYARRVGFPLEGLWIVDGSRRSTKANAFFTGFGRHKRVALFDTLVEKHPTDELVAIVGHEIGHYRLGHVRTNLVVGILQSGILFFLLSIFLTHAGLFEAFGVQQPSVHAGLVFFALLYSPLELILSVLVLALSRRHEFQADAFARRTLGNGEALARALERLAADTLTNLTPHPLYVALHHSHPPLVERVRALRGEEALAATP